MRPDSKIQLVFPVRKFSDFETVGLKREKKKMPSEELPKGRTELLQVLQGQGDKETLDFESKAQEGPA